MVGIVPDSESVGNYHNVVVIVWAMEGLADRKEMGKFCIGKK